MAKKSSETIIESAEADTAEGALSAAAVTEGPKKKDPLDHDEDGKKGGTNWLTTGELLIRIQKLEADIAYLRGLFGWPKA